MEEGNLVQKCHSFCFLTVRDAGEVTQLLVPEALLCIALLGSAIFSEYFVSIPLVPDGES